MRKKWITIILSIACVAVLAAAPFIRPDYELKVKTPQDREIITVMQVDGFEGGTGSRTAWLAKRAVEFESKHKGIFFQVSVGTVTELAEAMKADSLPDVVSFSGNLGEQLYPYLTPYTGSVQVRDDLAESGQAGGKQYALPWCMGGYTLVGMPNHLQKAGVGENVKLSDCLYSSAVSYTVKGETRQLQSLSCGFTDWNNPFAAVKAANPGGEKKPNALRYDETVTQYSAYDAFVAGYSSSVLLGTQRDIIRCNGRAEAGRMQQVRFQPLGGFTDLVQYLGFGKHLTPVKQKYAEMFAEFLQSETVQSKLTQIGLFNVLGESFYTLSGMTELETALSEKLVVPNVFQPAEQWKRLREESKP